MDLFVQALLFRMLSEGAEKGGLIQVPHLLALIRECWLTQPGRMLRPRDGLTWRARRLVLGLEWLNQRALFAGRCLACRRGRKRGREGREERRGEIYGEGVGGRRGGGEQARNDLAFTYYKQVVR